MDNNEEDVDPRNIKALSNEELTKLIVISNRMVGRLSNQLALMQNQVNELSKIILEARIIDSAKLHTLVDEIELASMQVQQEPAPQMIELPISHMNPRDSGLLGTSLVGASEGIVVLPKAPVIPPPVEVKEATE
jgi:hypothetical protein